MTPIPGASVPSGSEGTIPAGTGGTRHRWAGGLALTLLTAAAILAVLTGETGSDAEWGTWQSRVVASILLMPLPAMGALIVERRPGNPYGWVWLVAGLAGGALQLCRGYVIASLAHPALPLGEWVGLLTGPAWSILFFTTPFALLLFPTGRLPSPGWRRLTRAVLACGGVALVLGVFMPGEMGTAPVENPLGVGGVIGEVVTAVTLATTLAVLLAIVPATASLVVRYRSAGGVERLQLRWFAFAAVLFVLMFAVDFVLPEWPGVWEALKEGVPTALLPVAIGVAILRYRLYDIDRLISRAVGYVVITGLLVTTYVTGIFLLRLVLPGQGDLAVAASTLAAAALFAPLRTRVQGEVDRRFNRARYDAVRTVDGFVGGLRQEVEVEDLAGELQRVMASTLQPSSLSLWIRHTEGSG